MSSPTTTEDLLDLKLLPAWVNEPVRANEYSHFEGEDPGSDERGGRRPRERRRGSRSARGPNHANRAARNRASNGLAAQGRTGAARLVRMASSVSATTVASAHRRSSR